MDELFLLPSAPVAMPHAYWLDAHILSSQVVLLEPSKAEFQRIEAAFATRAPDKYDMEIVNDLYGNSCFIIPHRRYDLVTGELMSEPDQHWKYLGSTKGTWDANKVLAEVKFVHFSDWPYKKPWVETAEEETEENQPECRDVGGGKEDCRDRDVWAWLYKDFRERRGRVCGGGFSKREEG
jgi:alpha-N-acetylglucosamine transferase